MNDIDHAVTLLLDVQMNTAYFRVVFPGVSRGHNRPKYNAVVSPLSSPVIPSERRSFSTRNAVKLRSGNHALFVRAI